MKKRGNSKKLRNSCILTVAVLISSMLLSCGKSGDTGQVTLKFLISQPRLLTIYEKYTEQFVKEYNSKNNAQLAIELESIPDDKYAQLLKSKIAAGDQLDIIMLHAGNDLPDYVKGDFVEPLDDTKLSKVLYAGSAKGTTINGKLYGLPLESMNWAMLYNKDVFDSLGIKPADTLSELKDVTKKLKDSGKTPFLISYQETWIPQLFLPLIVGSIDSKTGFIAKMNKGEASFNDIKNDFFGVIDLVHSNGNKRGFEIGGNSGCAEFASGKYGMWVQGPWFAETILKVNENTKIGVAPLPINDDKNLTQIMQAITTCLVISKAGEHKKIAKEFLEYLISKEVANNFFSELKFNPVASTQDFEVYPWVQDSMKYIEEGRSYREEKIPQSVKDESGKLIQSYLAGSVTQDQVISELDKTWKTYLDLNK